MNTLRLIQYRNYTDQTIQLARHTIFVGNNGTGKTNIIEAMRTLSVTKSYRSQHDRDAIQWDQSYCRLIYTGETIVEYIFTTEGGVAKKAMKHDGSIVPLTSAYGLIPTVLFSPETMDLVTGSPQERRRFLDTLLGQADHAYLEALVTYRKVLKERHFVLLRLQQGLGATDELDFWDQELVRTGEIISHARASFVAAINTMLLDLFPRFVETNRFQSFTVQYKASAGSVQLTDKIKSSRFFDIKTGTTRYGPHRDELIFLLDERDVTLFASRGEIRICVLALKLAEAHYLKEVRQKEPILLLDDVFSELDASRRRLFIDAIKEFSSIVTTTDESFIEGHTLDDFLIYHLPLEVAEKPEPPKPVKSKRKKKETGGE